MHQFSFRVTAQACRWIGIILLSTSSLFGCTSMSPATKKFSTAVMEDRQFHPFIDLTGRLSIRYQQDGRDEALHGNFMWSQKGTDTFITLLSPLGQTIATIQSNPTQSILTQANQIPRIASDVDSLVANTLGWPLPIAGLRHWLQGFATDANGNRFIAQPELSETVTTRDGWRLRYASWHDDATPKRIDLARMTEQVGDVSIRIVIDTRNKQ
jgi:outer membrane lipoprotein LolB